jgi:hypothetical protein
VECSAVLSVLAWLAFSGRTEMQYIIWLIIPLLLVVVGMGVMLTIDLMCEFSRDDE